MDNPELDQSQTRKRTPLTSALCKKSFHQPSITSGGNACHVLSLKTHTASRSRTFLLMLSAGLFRLSFNFIFPITTSLDLFSSVAFPPVSISSYALCKHCAEKPSITSLLPPPHNLEPLFPVVMIGTRRRIPREWVERVENVEFNLRGYASCMCALTGKMCR